MGPTSEDHLGDGRSPEAVGADPTDMAASASTGTGADRPALLVAAGILLSRASGILREVALSAWLGVSTAAAESFAFALGVPKLLQNLLGEGALSASFIPVYAQVSDDDPAVARRLAGAVFGLLAALCGALVLVLMLAAKPIVTVIARGADPGRVDLIADLVRLMAPGIGFIVFAAWCLGILNSHRSFFLPFVAPVLWNAAIVVGVIIAATQTDDLADVARAAAWGVFLGGFLQFAVQLPRVLAIAGPITPSLDRSLAATRDVLRRFVPGVAGRGVVTLSTFVDLALSSFLAVGALAALTKAQTLYLMPISVFAISIAAADLPELSREQVVPGDATRRVARSVGRVVFFLCFSTVAFVLAGRPIVGALFERGEFRADDTVVVWLTLAVMSVGLLGSGLSRLLQNAAFAQGDVGGPARIALGRLIVAAALGLALMFSADLLAIRDGRIVGDWSLRFSPLTEDERGLENSHRLGAVGLAAGGAVAAWVEYALLRRRVGSVAARLRIGRQIARLVPALIIAGIVLFLLATISEGWHPLIAAPVVVAPAAVIYLLLGARAGNDTARDLIGALAKQGAGGDSEAR